jgi:catalase
MAASAKSIESRRIAVLAAAGVEVGALRAIERALHDVRATCRMLGEHIGSIATASGQQLAVEHTFLAQSSVLFDGVVVPGGAASVQALMACGAAVRFVLEAYRHGKAICVIGEGLQLLAPLGLGDAQALSKIAGIVVGRNDPTAREQTARDFVAALANHRHWVRPGLDTAGA